MTTAQEVVMRWSLALLLPTLALAAPVPKAKEISPPPFPTTVGDTREYEYRTGDTAREAHTDRVLKVEKQKDGSSHVTIERSNPKSDPPHVMVIGVSATGITRLANGDMEYSTPPVLLKLPADVGTKWEDGGQKYEVVAEEEVKVGAGKYKAAKVEQVFNGVKTTLWFAPGVGLVKMVTEGNESVLELKAFKPGK